MGGSGLLSSSLPFPVGCEDHLLPAKGEKHKQSFWLFLPFSNLFSSIFFFGSLFFPSSGGGSVGFFSPSLLHWW
jgi:hypothetical protein